MNMNENEWINVVLAVVCGAFILIKDRPYLAESWGRKFERLAGFSGWLLLAALFGMSWARIEIIGLLDPTLS